MSDQFSRTELLFGKEAMEKLSNARVAVFGIGGVGGHALEALVRSGVGTVDIIDNDTVCLSNLNRQLIATHKTIGQYKVDAAQQRMEEINPDVVIHKHRTFFLPETADQFDFAQYDYIVDAIDTVTGKLELAVRAKQAGVPIISSMGAGNKVDPTAFEVADIYETSVCPLAKVMRRELKKRGIDKLKVVYSREPARTPIEAGNVEETEEENGKSGVQISCGEPVRRRQIPGSNAFVPSVAGLIIAGEVIKGSI
ncbi:MAG: tRNA threonylcarbamoyladenosine dehydratase [Lachnospiraceae bacterium]|nr:tRNA threonylcarbamoyladenosine dehydratase [Lachnospiraceae bacterium]